MQTTNYDSSSATKRGRDKVISDSFTRQRPLLGITEQSIMNSVLNGRLGYYRKNTGGLITVNPGCPCNVDNPLLTDDISSAPIPGWATNINGSGAENGRGIATDSEGNVYITGYFDSTTLNINNFISGGGGGPVNITSFGTLTGSGTQDVFIVKYNTTGIAQWATILSGGGIFDAGFGIATDSVGNVYVTGQFNSAALSINSFSSVEPGGGAITLIPYGNLMRQLTNPNVFIVKFNTNGIAQWATNIRGGNDYSAAGTGIKTDALGNVYITGYGITLGTNMIINSFSSVTGSTINITQYGFLPPDGTDFYNSFIVKYNTNGIAQWATQIDISSSSFIDITTGIATDLAGNVYVTGYYNRNITIKNFTSVAPGGGIITLTSYGTLTHSATASNYDAFIIKYNTNGTALWATSVVGIQSKYGFEIQTDVMGNVYIIGESRGSCTVNSFGSVSVGTINVIPYGTLIISGDIDVFIVKYNTNGITQWATSLGGVDYDGGYGITTDVLDNVYVIGSFNSPSFSINSFVSGGDGGTITLTTYGTLTNSAPFPSTDVFIVKYNTNGIAQWATSVGGSESNEEGIGIATDTLGNIYITGYYGSSSLLINTFDSVIDGSVILSLYGTLANISSNDTFIIKYNTNGKM